MSDKKQKPVVEILDKDNSYYQLVPPEKTRSEVILYLLSYPFVKPLRLLQFFTGRLISYLLLNPLFRKEDEENTILEQNTKYPDPQLKDQGPIDIINILPRESGITRSNKNWLFQLQAYWNNSPLVQGEGLEPEKIKDDSRIDTILQHFRDSINKGFKPDHIHFRGLHLLTDDQKDRLFSTLKTEYQYDLAKNRQQYQFYTLKTEHGFELDSVEIHGNGVDHEDYKNRKFIISCLPRSNNYTDWLRQHRYTADQTQSTVIAFNYRGTGQSKGIAGMPSNLLKDSLAQAHRLIALGVPAENIVFSGECLGANIATKTAAFLRKKEGEPVKLYNARSFRSVPAMILSKILPADAHPANPLTWLRYGLAGITIITVFPLLYLTGWDLSVDKAFSSIPPKDRDFLVVRSKKDEKGKRFSDDLMVPHEQASIYSLVKAKQERLRIKSQSTDLTDDEQDWLKDTRHLHKFYVDPDQRKDAVKLDGHTVQPRYLTQRVKQKEGEVSELPTKKDGRTYAIEAYQRFFKGAKPSLDSDLPEVDAALAKNNF